MKKNYLCKLLWIISFVGLFTACDNDDYDGPAPDEVTANYSNKLADGDRANLALTYSGSELIGKSVYFKTTDAKTAEMTLINVLPHDSLAKIENVSLTPDGSNGYKFSGNATATTTGTTFKYDGAVTDGKLTVNLSEVKMPANVLSSNGGNGTWYLVHNALTEETEDDDFVLWTTCTNTSYYNNDQTNTINWIFAFFAKPLLDNIFSIMLDDITFQSDGNITAHYAGFPENVTFTDILPNSLTATGGLYVTGRPESEFKLSSINLANYYMEDASTFYVIPNIDMIINQIQKDKTGTRSISVDGIKEFYSQLIKWSTNGIKFHIEDNPSRVFSGNEIDGYTKFNGDYIIYIDPFEMKALAPLMDMLPIILKLIAPDMLDKTIGELAGDMLPPMLKPSLGKMKITELLPKLGKELGESNLKIGIYLYNSKQ